MQAFAKPYAELTPDELYDLLRVRAETFVVGQRCFYLDPDGLDKTAVHVGLRGDDGTLAACARLYPEDGAPGTWHVGRVLAVRRGEGLGRRLMAEVERAALARGASLLRMESQRQAAGFYARLGWCETGPDFDEAGIPHVRMEKPLPAPSPGAAPPAAPSAPPPAFRPMRRAAQALDDGEIRDVLHTAKRGVLAVTGDGGRPYCVTLNPLYDEATGRLWFHGAKAGHKIDALRRDPRACFTAIDDGVHDPSRPPAWALTYRSVVVFGHVEFVDDHEQALDICRRLCRRFPMDEESIEKEIRLAGASVLVFALVPEHITGKRVHEA